MTAPEPHLAQFPDLRGHTFDRCLQLVEVTWDAIAAFLPVTHDPTPTVEAQQRLTVISRAAVDGTADQPPRAFLDVGASTAI